MRFHSKGFSPKLLTDLYYHLLKPRLIEEKMLILLRQGRISKWFSGIGQEAISVGTARALEEDEFILTMHRNLGVFTSREIPLDRLFAQFEGKMTGFTKGRDRSFHFGSIEHHIVGMISHLGAQLGVGDGIALSHLLKKEPKVTAAFCGDGATSEGDFHEALNVAAVWDLPVIFMIENNGYGLSTPSREQFKFESFLKKGPAYGIEAVSVDGNNILEVYATVKKVAQKIRKDPRPVLIEANTFRMRGHEEASGTKYIPPQLFEEWGKKDPIDNYEKFLIQEKVLDQSKIKEIRDGIKAEIEKGLDDSSSAKYPQPDSDLELADQYAPFTQKVIEPSKSLTTEKRLVDAISDAIRQSLEKYPDLIVMGQDIAKYGGVFKVTEGFVDTFGKDRIRNTPLCESAIVGIGLGLSLRKIKSIIEMQFADFATCGFNQIINNLAKIHYRWGENADVVIRMPTGAGVGAGPFHSQSNESWFFHTPGLKVIYPSNPKEAKGLLCAAIEDPNPVLFFEHKALYRSLKGEVPSDYYTIEIGKANLVRRGDDISIITYGMGVVWAEEYLDQHPDVKADLLDLRTLLPWDKEAVRESVMKTGKVFILHEDCISGGIGAEISSWISEHCFEYLDGPIVREGGLDTPVPFVPVLEKNFLPQGRLKQKIEFLLEF